MIEAKIIAHSKSAVDGKRIVTFELVYPRFIHGELMTHRVFSRNAASSRAIPVKTMIEQVRISPAMPVHWGKNQPGMQAKDECFEQVFIRAFYDNAIREGKSEEQANIEAHVSAKYAWGYFADEIADFAEQFSIAGYHKQIVNRILEPFQWMKTVVTATEWDNFFWLRNHPDAQPEIRELARMMLEALDKSAPVLLEAGDWHTPYFGAGYWLNGCGIALEDALAVSASCCAQVSYRKLDDGIEKAKDIYARLVESEPVHASPFEHQATPIEDSDACFDYMTWPEGVTHMDRNGCLWSGNFKGFIQHRQLIPNNVCTQYNNNSGGK